MRLNGERGCYGDNQVFDASDVLYALDALPRCIARIRELEGEQEEAAARAKRPIGHLGPRGCRNCGRSQGDVALDRIAQLLPASTWQCEHCGTEHAAL